MPSVPCSDRLSTGRRHIRAGSVHVTELIRQRPRACNSARPSSTEEHSQVSPGTQPNSGEQPPHSHHRPGPKAVQVAKIISLGVASVVLCGSVAAGSMINHQRQEDAAAAAARPQVDINGERALLPDVLNRAVPRSGVIGIPGLPGPAISATGTIENPGAPPPAPTEAAPPPVADPGTSQATEEPIPRSAFVERFYRLIPTEPGLAFTHLDGSLLGTELVEFERSWSDVRDIQVETRDQGDDVLALVRLQLSDGSHLLVQQLVQVTDTVPQRITGARVLSAQRN